MTWLIEMTLQIDRELLELRAAQLKCLSEADQYELQMVVTIYNFINVLQLCPLDELNAKCPIASLEIFGLWRASVPADD